MSAIDVSRERFEKLMAIGLSDYITKPFAADELLGRVKRVLAE